MLRVARSTQGIVRYVLGLSEAVGGLRFGGRFVIVGVPPEPLGVNVLPLIFARQTVAGWASGTSIDSEDTLKFSALTGVKPLIEEDPLRSEEHTSELQSQSNLVCRLLLGKKKKKHQYKAL